jgi:heme a synthase
LFLGGRTKRVLSTYRHGISTLTLAWTALAANAVVILQGALVRATGSGAGCGSHWPTCNGAVIPMSHTAESLMEFGHRLLSLVVLVLGAWLLARVWKTRRENPALFAFGAAAFFFLVVEALLGAATVLFGLTGDNTTVARGLMVASHLVNSLLLVGALTLTVVATRTRLPWPLRLREQGALVTVMGVAVLGMLVLMFTGGIAAMGNTMFPAESLQEGLRADFDAASHPLIRLRILHPIIAVTIGVYLFVALGLTRWLKPVPEASGLMQALLGVYVAQLVVGTVNLALLAPTVLQLLHLMMAVLAFALLSAVAVVTIGYPARAQRPSPSSQRTAREFP